MSAEQKKARKKYVAPKFTKYTFKKKDFLKFEGMAYVMAS